MVSSVVVEMNRLSIPCAERSTRDITLKRQNTRSSARMSLGFSDPRGGLAQVLEAVGQY
jgi:hypothetical protein